MALLGTMSLPAQRLSECWKSVPAAVCEKAPMPEEMANKYARLEQERRAKYLASPANTVPAVSPIVIQKKNMHLRAVSDTFRVIAPNVTGYRVLPPVLKLVNSSHGREAVKDKEGKFNPKKDRISYAIIQNGNEIQIINHDHKPVNMSEFTFTVTGETVGMNGNKINILPSVVAIAQGHYPWTHQIKCLHTSGAQYTFDLQFVWPKQFSLSGEKHAFALSPIHGQADNLALLCDLDSKEAQVIRLPLLIESDGHHGANGRNGHTGAAGSNEYSWKDKEGKVHTSKGTCGQAGEDGGNGQDGTDGGQFLFCLSPEIIATYGLDGVIATIDAGLGGKGGKGGRGGKHGKGSGCSGTAPDGKDGRDGRDGKRGDFLYVQADVETFYQRIFPFSAL